jgi:hypothetical protein
MTLRSTVWTVVGVLFVAANVGAGVMVAGGMEAMHAASHFALALIGAGLVWRFSPYARRFRQPDGSATAQLREINDHMMRLEQASDAIAIEVERIGEGQRFMTRVLTGKATPQALGESAAEPIDLKSREAAHEGQ